VCLILSSAGASGNVLDVIAYDARYKGRAYEGLMIERKDFSVAHTTWATRRSAGPWT